MRFARFARTFSTQRFIGGTSLLILTLYLGYVVERSNFTAFIAAYGLFFALYAWLISRKNWTSGDRRWFIGLGIVLRASLLFSIPNLSDDFYRFLWDGRLAAQGIHPFAHTPAYFIQNQIELAGITPELFAKLNSPGYHTVYPPVCQGVFWLAAKLFPGSISGGVFVLKLFLFLCDLGVLWVLTPPPTPPPMGRGVCSSPNLNFVKGEAPLPIGGGAGGGVIYALNPLIILEITGNAHFEGAMLCLLLAGILALQRKRLLPGAAFWALATASKLVPLLFLPIIWVQLGFRKGLRFLLMFAGFTALLFAPLLDFQIIENMANSLNLYFRQFAFNASVYYVLKSIGKALLGSSVDVGRTLGPILGFGVFLGVWLIAFFSPRRYGGTERDNSVPPCLRGEKSTINPELLLFASTLYLALATTVHPWYITLPFGLSLLTKWRFPILWTGLAALSYSHYAGGGFQENYWLIAVEYLALCGFAVWEFRASNA